VSKNFLFNPRTYQGDGHDQKTKDIMTKTIARFEHKGLREMKLDDRDNRYCDYFVKEQRDQEAFAHMLTPKGYGKIMNQY
jgi:acyl-CoA dehydrogenase